MAKILYFGKFKKLWDEEAIARALENLGHTVIRVSEQQSVNRFHEAYGMIDKSYDIILYAKLQISMDSERKLIFKKLQQMPGKKVCWIPDLYFGLRREHKIGTDPIFKSDYVFTPDGGHDEEFKKYRVNHHLLRQGIHEAFCYRAEPEKQYEYDVVFVGCYNSEWIYREQLCLWLRENYNFKRFGEVNTEEIRGDKLNKLYASAKIIIGDSVFSPHYWSNRIYETLGRGGFLIHPDIPGLGREFAPYKHYIPYRMGDYNGLKTKLDYFLKHPEERRKIADAALEYTKKHFIYEERLKSLFKIIYEI